MKEDRDQKVDDVVLADSEALKRSGSINEYTII